MGQFVHRLQDLKHKEMEKSDSLVGEAFSTQNSAFSLVRPILSKTFARNGESS